MIQVQRARTEQEAHRIHRLISNAMGPCLPGPIDKTQSFAEVRRIVVSEFAIIAIEDGRIAATIGLVAARFWWNPSIRFLANRWLVSLPGSGALMPLMRTAVRCAKAAGVELQVYDENKGRLMIFNSPRTKADVLQ